MRVCLEATSLIGPRSGVGHSTAALASALLACDPNLRLDLLPLSATGTAELERFTAGEARFRAHPARLSVRCVTWLWWRTEWPPADRLCRGADVVHGPNYLLPPLRRIPGVLTVHDLTFVRHPGWVNESVGNFRRTVPRTADRATRIIVPSTFIAEEVSDWLPHLAGRVRVVPMGVRECFLHAEARPSADPYVVFLGNLEERKNLSLLLRAFSVVASRLREGRLVLVGQPSVGWEDIADDHEDLLASGRVTVTGYLPDDEAASLVAGARALAYPSRYEGFGMPPLEAMAAGVPVIATRCASLPEVLGPHARYVDHQDPDDLAGALTEALTGEPDPGALAAARSHASAYTWERSAAETLRVYGEAVEEGPR